MSDGDVDPAATPLEEWLDRLAERGGAPGGGAASAVMTAISAALLGMVAVYTPDEPESDAAAPRLRRIRRAATRGAEEDGIRSAAFGAALAMDDGPDREREVRKATADAIASSIEIGLLAATLLPEARLLAEIGSHHVEADLVVALEALRAALAGAAATARSNMDLLATHRAPGDDLDARVAAFQDDVDAIARAQADAERLARRGQARGGEAEIHETR